VDNLKFIFSALIGGGVAWGSLRAEIYAMKEKLNSQSLHGERLAAIEAKIDILINKN